VPVADVGCEEFQEPERGALHGGDDQRRHGVGRMRAYCARVGVEYNGEPRGHRRGRRIAAGQNVGEFVVAVMVGDERVAIRAVGPHSIDRSWAFNANESLVAIGDDQEERFGASAVGPRLKRHFFSPLEMSRRAD
jgi:hypothetical protein